MLYGLAVHPFVGGGWLFFIFNCVCRFKADLHELTTSEVSHQHPLKFQHL